MSEKYPIEWRGETHYASDLTDEIKNKYCVWLYNHMLDNARRFKTAKEYLEFERRLTSSPPEWTTSASLDVVASFGSDDAPNVKAHQQLMRLILDLDKNAMSEDDLLEMVREKEADPSSDLNRAMKRIKEDADPKVQRGKPSLPRPMDANGHMPPSATSQSASAEAKSAT